MLNEHLLAEYTAARDACDAYCAAHLDPRDGMSFIGTDAEYAESCRLNDVAQEAYHALFEAGAPPVSDEEMLALVPPTPAARAYQDYTAEFHRRTMRGRGRPAKAPEHQRQHYGVYFTEAERAAIQAVMAPGEDFSAFMREAAALLIAARS